MTITAVAARTGVSVPSLRAWEQRHGFPNPSRLVGGHRRYSEADVTQVEQVLAERAAGRSLETAIARVTARTEEEAAGAVDLTLFAGLRRHRPELAPQLLSRRSMLALSRSIEDECAARGMAAHLIVAFQRAAVYRRAHRQRWAGFSRTAASTIVFADFARSRVDASGVRQIALPADAAQVREWALVCDGPGVAAALAGWERADGRFEAVWSVDPTVVRSATLLGRRLAERHAPGLDLPPAPDNDVTVDGAVLGRAVSLVNRTVAYLDATSQSWTSDQRRARR